MSRPTSTYTDPNTNANSSVAADFAQGNPAPTSVLAQSMSTNPAHGGAFSEEGGSSVLGGENGTGTVDGAPSTATTAVQASAPSRSNTLKKRGSVKRTTSLKRSNSKRSLKAGSLAGFGGVDGSDQDRDYNSAFSTPIPTQGSPTEILANRFQAWRQLLKSLIAYFREIQASYEARAKATHKIQGVISSISNPSVFMSTNGLGDATKILDDYHRRSATESNKSREIEEDVIGALTGLRSDLGQKIKEIKSLSSDFKNSVDKEKDATRREVERLQEAIQLSEREDGSALGKGDPFVVKLGVDRAVEKQIDEENYLHRAYLNLESSGRELESIVVGEIQKAYNALAGILKREGDDAYTTVDSLRSGPISMSKDAEWLAFVEHDPHFVDPNLPLRKIEDIEYEGKHHPSAVEVRSGMLERKSKYLKSYTPGWYVLSPTHLHEFKSADKIYSQPPVMSLYLPDQKLGSHSQQGSSSHKFMVKGKQSGNMHKGHNWVFRAETYDTMLAWFEDMRILTEKTGEERNAFVRKHARSFSSNSRRASVSSDGMEEDEADAVPYSADVASLQPSSTTESRPVRPQPGGRFPSDPKIQTRNRGESFGQDSVSSMGQNDDAAALAGGAAALPVTSGLAYANEGHDPYRLDGVTAGTRTVSSYTWDEPEPPGTRTVSSYTWDEGYHDRSPLPTFHRGGPEHTMHPPPVEPDRSGEWIAPAATGAAGGAAAVAALEAQAAKEQRPDVTRGISDVPVVPEKSAQRISPTASGVAIVETPPSATTAKAPEALAPEPLVAAMDSPPQPTKMWEGVLLPRSEGPSVIDEGAQRVVPVRHGTDVSISQLHVPGEFPKR